MALKIETSNPAIGQPLDGRVGSAHQLLAGTARPTTLLPKETVGIAHPTADIINLSIPTSVSGEKLSSLLSNLIKLLNLPDDALVGAGFKPAPTADTNAHDLIKVMESLFYKGEEPLSFLKNFIEKSGLLYEAKIAKGDIKGFEDDLKGLLLKLIGKQGEKSVAGKAANALLSDIEARQLLNIKSKEEGVFHLQIPVFFPQGASTADVYVKRDGKGKGEYMGDSCRVGFSIELREAGLVSIDALVSRKGRDVTCYVSATAENAEFLEFMKAHIPELSERLSGYGIKIEVK